jgi:hypothetical protein
MVATSKEKKDKTKRKPRFFRRFDTIVLSAIAFLGILTLIFFFTGDRSSLKVDNFSWEDKKIGVEDRYFTIDFNRPVDRASVEKKLKIIPELPGQISWSGGRLFYSLKRLPNYNTTYQIILSGAEELNKKATNKSEIFKTQIKTRDLIFAYIGVDNLSTNIEDIGNAYCPTQLGERKSKQVKEKEQGRLILYNLSQCKKTILTPLDVVVTNFKSYPNGEKIIFSAFESSLGLEGISQQQLFTVTTGINWVANSKTEPTGRIQIVLDNKFYKNFKFDLSADGKTILVQRSSRSNASESGLWIISNHEEPRPLGIPGNDFRLAPNGETVAIIQKKGVAIVPLNQDISLSQYFQGYENILGFSRNGEKKLMVVNNPDYTRSLFLVNKKEAKEIFKTIGPIPSCEFEPINEELIYCIKTELAQQEDKYVIEPFLSAINTTNLETTPLLKLPQYQDVRMSMSPDGQQLLFDQIIPTTLAGNNVLVTDSGQTISTSAIWGLPLTNLEVINKPSILPPKELVKGFHPRWIP